jgi:hypothetical protein
VASIMLCLTGGSYRSALIIFFTEVREIVDKLKLIKIKEIGKVPQSQLPLPSLARIWTRICTWFTLMPTATMCLF